MSCAIPQAPPQTDYPTSTIEGMTSSQHCGTLFERYTESGERYTESGGESPSGCGCRRTQLEGGVADLARTEVDHHHRPPEVSSPPCFPQGGRDPSPRHASQQHFVSAAALAPSIWVQTGRSTVRAGRHPTDAGRCTGGGGLRSSGYRTAGPSAHPLTKPPLSSRHLTRSCGDADAVTERRELPQARHMSPRRGNVH